jgi:GT2 family glycosyltransferase
MSTFYKKAMHSGIQGVKKVLRKNPRLKNALKRVIMTQLAPLSGKNTYDKWIERNLPDFIDVVAIKEAVKRLSYQPLISIALPTYETNIDFLYECIDSIRGQAYDNWELCIIDDASPSETVRDVIRLYAKNDSRIKYKFLKTNHHIAGATNEAIKLATGDFVSLMDHDDILWPNALYEVVKALNEDKKSDLLYSDEDKITDDRHEHTGYFFKPDWNPDFLRSVNYITHFTTVRKTLLEQIGGFKKEYNGAQDWDLFLRITNITHNVYHIPKIIYSWRVHDGSTAKDTQAKPYVVEAQQKALTEDMRRRGYNDATIERDTKHTGYWNMTYPVQGEPLISIVIPSKDQYKIIRRCITSIYKKTTYQNFEIVLVDTGSTDVKVLRWYNELKKQHENFKLVDFPEQPFSHSRSSNKGAEVARGELLVMLNNDTEVLTPNWLELMAGDAQRQEIGAVGCLLFFPDGYHIQHAGVGVGLGGVAANAFSMMTLDQPMSQTQHLMLNTKHNMTAVTAACLMMRKEVFNEVGGFSKDFRSSYNDVDLCLRLFSKGYQNFYTPYVRLIHHESISMGTPEEVQKRDTTEFKKSQKLFVNRWHAFVRHDPNLNPNLSKNNAFYDIELPMRQQASE